MEDECYATTLVDETSGNKKDVVLYPGIDTGEVQAVLGAAFSLESDVVGIKDPAQNIAFPLSLLSRAPAYFSKRAAYTLLTEYTGPAEQAGVPNIIRKPPKNLDLRCIKMKDAVETFQAMSTDGCLDLPSFLNCFSSLLGEQVQSIPGALNQLKWLFSIFDKDQNGVVDATEFLGGLSIYAQGEQDAEDKIRQAFALYDLDGNGSIEQAEMCAYLRSVFTVLAEVMPEVFARHAVGADELAEATAATCFKEADLNGDGRLSFEEFRRWYTSNEGGLLCELAAEYGPQHFTLPEVRRLLNLGAFRAGDVLAVLGTAAGTAAGAGGRLGRAAFARAFGGLLEVPREPALTAAERQLAAYVIGRLFDVFDTDGDGAVDAAELAAGLSMLCGGAPEDKVRAAFALYDKDGDGYITYAEMAGYLASIYRLLYETRPALAAEVGCGVEELAAATAGQAFRDADADGDGRLSLAEFRAWYASGRATSAGGLLELDRATGTARFSLGEVRRLAGLRAYRAEDVFAFFARAAGPERRFTRALFRRCFEALAAERGGGGGGGGGGVPEGERGAWEAALEQLFDSFDQDRDGTVDFKELGAGLQLLCAGGGGEGGEEGDPGDAAARTAFALHDVDGSGYISLQNMVDYLAATYRVLFEADPALRGKLGATPEQLAEATAEQAFQEADLDRDFRLSYSEFKRWFEASAPGGAARAGEAPAFTVAEVQAATDVGARDVDTVLEAMAECADGAGFLTRPAFRGCFEAMAELHQGGPLDAAAAARLRALLDRLFELMDAAGDGVLSLHELAAGLSVLCHGGGEGPRRVAAVFRLYDADGDGFLSLGEMASYLSLVFRMIFATAPEARPDAQTTPEELGWLTAEAAFRQAGLSRDGRLSFEEFLAWYDRSSSGAAGAAGGAGVEEAGGEEEEEEHAYSLWDGVQLLGLHELPPAELHQRLAGHGDPAGRLDGARFAAAMQELAGPALRFFPRADRLKMADFAQLIFQAFQEEEAAGGGPYVRVPELVAGLSGVSAGSAEERVAAAFALYDRDGDGRIDLAEMTGYLTAVFKFVYGVGNGPSCGSMAGVSPEVLAAKVAKRFIQVMDTDHDGTVSFGEFYKWYTSHSVGEPLAADQWKELLVFDVPHWLSLDEAKRLTGLAGQSVRDVFQRFAAHADDGGELGKEAFTAALSHLGAAHDLAEHDALKFHYLADRLFDAFDADHNGTVSFGELTAGLSFLCAEDAGGADARMRTVWEFLDDDGDGHVSPDEMRRYMVAIFRVLYETHPGMREKLGVTAEEIGTATADHAFEDADTNHDGHLSYEEFTRWYQSGAGAFLQQTTRAALSVEEIRRLTGLGDVPLAQAVRAFAARAGPGGTLSRAGFFAAAAAFLDPHAPGADDRRAQLQSVLNALYDLFDADGDGRVDLAELSAGLSVVCAGSPSGKVAEIFALFDADGDGFITYGEMKAYLRSVFAVMYAAYPEQLAGGVSAEQLAAATAAQAFAEADANHDGVISLEEFTAWYRRGSGSGGGPPPTGGGGGGGGGGELARLLKLDCFSRVDLAETFGEAAVCGRLGFAAYMRQMEHLHTLGGGLERREDAGRFIDAAERVFRALEDAEGTVGAAALVAALAEIGGGGQG